VATVLIVDDGADMRRLVVDLLRVHGHEAREAGTGTEALERLEADPLPDLVMLDVQMPELDGWDTLHRLRTDPRTAELPVVMCTVKAGELDTALGWELGCDGYVTKPFAIDSLIREMETILSRSPDERQRRRRQVLDELTRE
jgi:CheY-like chemotaxis protein